MTGTPEATTCPFACLERATPHVAELTRAVALRELVPLAESLGRPLCAVDHACLAALHGAQADVVVSDRHLAEQKRQRAKP